MSHITISPTDSVRSENLAETARNAVSYLRNSSELSNRRNMSDEAAQEMTNTIIHNITQMTQAIPIDSDRLRGAPSALAIKQVEQHDAQYKEEREALQSLNKDLINLLKSLYQASSYAAKDSALSNFTSTLPSILSNKKDLSPKLQELISQIHLYNTYIKDAQDSTNSAISNNQQSIHEKIIRTFFQNTKIFYNIIDSMNQTINIISELNKDSIASLNLRQQEISKANDILSIMRINYPKQDSGNKMDPTVQTWMKQHLGNDIEAKFKDPTMGKYEQAVLAVKGWIDDRNSFIQVEMVFIKKISNEFNQFVEMKNSLLDKINKANNSVISSLRL